MWVFGFVVSSNYVQEIAVPMQCNREFGVSHLACRIPVDPGGLVGTPAEFCALVPCLKIGHVACAVVINNELIPSWHWSPAGLPPTSSFLGWCGLFISNRASNQLQASMRRYPYQTHPIPLWHPEKNPFLLSRNCLSILLATLHNS